MPSVSVPGCQKQWISWCQPGHIVSFKPARATQTPSQESSCFQFSTQETKAEDPCGFTTSLDYIDCLNRTEQEYMLPNKKSGTLWTHLFVTQFQKGNRRHFGRCTLVCWWLNISKALHAVGHFLSSKCFAVLMPLYIVLGAFWSRQSWLSQLLSSSGTWWIRLLGTDWNRNSSLWKEAVLGGMSVS